MGTNERIVEMFITNLIIDTKLVATSQEYGQDTLVMTFWTFKHATRGKWINTLSEMNREGYYIDNAIWEKHLRIDPSWTRNLSNATYNTRTIIENGRWKIC
jgi:hypothetical protein